MKKFLSSKTVLLGLGCLGVLNVFALSAPAQIPSSFGNLPLYFTVASPDQADYPMQFVARGGDYQFLISPTGVQIALTKAAAKPAKVRMNFAGANAGARISGDAELPGKINYLIGNNPAQWRTGVATFARVRVEQLYPGINLVYYGNQQQLEYDFALTPGANPKAIKIRFDGVDRISIGARGELILRLGMDEILQPAPIIYQTVNGARCAVSGGYRILDEHTVAFTVGKYDHQLPLVIDPILSFSTYFGGNSSDAAWSIALCTNDGSIYIAGQTLSKQLSATNTAPFSTATAFQGNFAGGSITGDAFVARFDNQGSNLIFLTYLGGSGDDVAYGIAVDGNGNAYIAGTTDSTNFPVVNTIPGGTNIGGTFNKYANAYLADAFVAKLDAIGSDLLYSTYLGGGGADAAYGIALDSSNDAYVTGFTYSTNFPTTSDAFQKHLAVTNWAYQAYYNANAFVAEISASGTNLLYSSYFGGTNFDQGKGIAVDSSNNIYVTGFTASKNFPITNAIFQQFVQTNFNGTNQVLITNSFNGSLLNGSTNRTSAYDAFVAKFAPGCTSLVYSTLLGGTNSDKANGIAVDGSGNAYVTGWTISTNFPNTATNVAGLYNGLTNNRSGLLPLITNVFLTQVTWNGSNAAIGYSAVFGGTNRGIDIGYGVAVDPSGNAFVVGASSTTNFPVLNTPGLVHTTNSGGSDAFVIAFNPNGSVVLYSGYLGGKANDYGYGIAVDSLTNVYLAGQTASTNFPTFFPFQSSLQGPSDAFLAKIGWAVVPPEIVDQSTLTNQEVQAGSSVTFTITATGTPPLSYQWQFQGTNLIWTNLVNGGTNLVGGGVHISGATNAALTISYAETNDSGSYQVIVTNYAGSTNSSVAVLTVTNIPTVLTLQPTNQTVGVGSTAEFSINGTAQSPFSLQWLKDGTNLVNKGRIRGATNATLVISNVQTSDEGTYWIVVTTPWGSLASSNAVLTVVSFPTILTPPTNQTVGLGSLVPFVVNAVGQVPLSYRWLANGTILANGGRISGVTNSVLTIINAQTLDDKSYWVIVSNSVGSVTSSPPAVLLVLTSPNFTGITTDTNGNLIFSGVGGTNNGTYFVLTSTNLATPLALWTPIVTNQFDSLGGFFFINTPPINTPQQFYILQMP